MKTFLKKHKYKLLTLMLSIVSIFTLFLGINKTYAYTSDRISYTLSGYTETTIGNYKGILWNGQSMTLNVIDTNGIQNNDYLLYNVIVFDSNNNIVNENTSGVNNLDPWRFIYNVYTNSAISNYYNRLIDSTYYFQQYKLYNISYITNGATTYQFTLNYYEPTYKYLFINMDIVHSYDIGLQQYYETYYGQIEDNYNALLSDYNDLQNDYDTLEGNYNTLLDNYDILENNYNQLNGNINNLNDFYNYGFIAFMKNGYTDSNDNVYSTHFTIYYVDRNTNTFLSKEYPLTLNDVVSYFGGSSLSLYELSNYYIDLLKNSITNFTDLYYISECNLYIELQSLFNIEYIDFINNDFTYDMELFIRNSVDNIGVYFNDLDSINTNINSTKILEKNVNLKQFNSIEFDKISYDSDLHEPFITLNNVASAYYNNGFNNGYQSGLQQGKDSQQTIINDLNNQITILTSRVTNLEYLNQALNEQINSFNTDYNLNNLMWTIASTPFDSFKQIWNVNFFGVNISSVITGFLTGIIVLWIIKKFFL